MPLNEKQTRFAHAYVACGGNGRAAAIQAGYSHTSAAKRACDLLKVPEVQNIVQTHRDAVLRATEDFDVVEELIGLYQDVGSLGEPCRGSQRIGNSGATAESRTCQTSGSSQPRS